MQKAFYLLLNCGAFLAFLSPYFLRSFILGSLVKNPADLSVGLYSAFASNKALAIPCLTAPAWPERPPPSTLQIISNLSTVFVTVKGCLTITLSISVPKYSSRVSPLTVMFPFPSTNLTLAIDFFLLPVPQNTIF